MTDDFFPMTPLPPPPNRTPLQGTLQILRFNQPFYFASAILAGLGIALLCSGLLPRWLVVLGWAGLGLLFWWTIASVAASWFIYDYSPLMQWRWVPDLLGGKPARWVNLHAGLDESTPTLHYLLNGTGEAWDFYNPKTMTEPSIEKARRETPESDRAPSVRTDALPAESGTINAAFLFFAAHEIRDAHEREVFWEEMARIVKLESGRIIVAEHLRDRPNFIAFGPGFFHFLPRAEWLRLFAHAGLVVRSEQAITPFTRVFVLEPKP